MPREVTATVTTSRTKQLIELLVMLVMLQEKRSDVLKLPGGRCKDARLMRMRIVKPFFSLCNKSFNKNFFKVTSEGTN